MMRLAPEEKYLIYHLETLLLWKTSVTKVGCDMDFRKNKIKERTRYIWYIDTCVPFLFKYFVRICVLYVDDKAYINSILIKISCWTKKSSPLFFFDIFDYYSSKPRSLNKWMNECVNKKYGRKMLKHTNKARIRIPKAVLNISHV